MIIEFIGAPGAGKTTLMPTVKDFLRERGFQPWSVVEAGRPFVKRSSLGRWVDVWMPASLRGAVLWQAFYQASKLERRNFRNEHRALMESVNEFQSERPISRTDRDHVLRWFHNLTGQYRFLNERARHDDVLIFDEGFSHRVVQLFASENEIPDLASVKDYLSRIPKPDLIIHPKASLETCLERVYQRGIWERFRSKDEASISRFMSHAHTIVNFAVEYLLIRGWTILDVDNDGQSPAAAQVQLQQKLSSVYSLEQHKISLPLDV